MKHVLIMAAAVFMAGSAQAVTVSEGDFIAPNGDTGSFSSIATEPSLILSGTDRIEGTGAANDFDFFEIRGFEGGTLTFTFDAPDSAGNSFNAGGNILFSTTAFPGPFGGTFGANFSFGGPGSNAVRTLAFDDDFGDSLFLGLLFTNGNNFSYSIDLPTPTVVISPATVPVPAALLLLGSGLFGFAYIGRKKV